MTGTEYVDRTGEPGVVFAAHLDVWEAREAADVAADVAEDEQVERVAAWLAKEYGELLNPNPADDPPGYWEFQARELLEHAALSAVPPADEALDQQHADMCELLNALGLGAYARPYSTHEVMQRDAIPAARELLRTRDAVRELITWCEWKRDRYDDNPDGEFDEGRAWAYDVTVGKLRAAIGGAR